MKRLKHTSALLLLLLLLTMSASPTWAHGDEQASEPDNIEKIVSLVGVVILLGAAAYVVFVPRPDNEDSQALAESLKANMKPREKSQD